MSKICFYLESYYVGGLDTFTIDLINNWPNKDDNLYLVFNSSHTAFDLYKKNIFNPNAKLISHKMIMVPFLQVKFKQFIANNFIYSIFSFILQYVLMIYYIFFSYFFLKMYKYDKLMIINGGYPAGNSCRGIAISWGLYSNKKSIHNFHNYASKPKKINLFLENLIDSLVCKYTETFVSVSKSCSLSIHNRPSIFNFKNVKFIYNGINSIVVNKHDDIRKELGLKKSAKILLLLATYEKRKGHDFILNVFRNTIEQNTDTFLLFMGYGSDMELVKINNSIKLLNLEKKVFVKNYSDNAMEVLAQSDILLIGSQENESFGLTAIEAMKYKIPVVSTNVGGLREVIVDGDGGFLFDKDNVIGFSQKIIELLDNDKLRIEQGNKGFFRYQKYFQIERTANEYYNLINKL